MGIVVWGLLLSAWLARAWFVFPPDRVPFSHEQASYALRLVEFRDCLAAGYWSPQWCTHFWGGLGSPYFSYYQPGLFYVASLVPWSVPPTRALGLAVFGLALVGYAGMYVLTRSFFDRPAAGLAATNLLLSVYVGTDLYRRGDLSEFAAMMLCPAALAALAAVLKSGGARRASLLAILAATVVVMHPCVALPFWGLLVLTSLGVGWGYQRWIYAAWAAAALCAGAGLSAFYWLPILTERHLVHAERITQGSYHYGLNFVPWTEFAWRSDNPVKLPFVLGYVLLPMAMLNLCWHWRPGHRTATPERHLATAAATATLLLVWLMTSAAAWLWKILPLLPMLQMPWRLLSLATIFLSLVAAAVPSSVAPKWRRAWIGLGLLSACWLAPSNTPLRLSPDIVSDSAAELVDANIAPDVQGEWAPRSVPLLLLYPPNARSLARLVGPDDCVIQQESLAQGHLSLHVVTISGGALQLKHFYFAAGWRATLDGAPLALGYTDDGFMRVVIPPHTAGRLDIRFGMTPARQRGWLISLASALFCVAALATDGKLRRQ